MRQVILPFADGKNKDHRDYDLLMASQVVVELKIKIRFLTTCFLVFTENILSNDKSTMMDKKLFSVYYVS